MFLLLNSRTFLLDSIKEYHYKMKPVTRITKTFDVFSPSARTVLKECFPGLSRYIKLSEAQAKFYGDTFDPYSPSTASELG